MNKWSPILLQFHCHGFIFVLQWIPKWEWHRRATFFCWILEGHLSHFQYHSDYFHTSVIDFTEYNSSMIFTKTTNYFWYPCNKIIIYESDLERILTKQRFLVLILNSLIEKSIQLDYFRKEWNNGVWILVRWWWV